MYLQNNKPKVGESEEVIIYKAVIYRIINIL